jgi:hypothetical protein
MKAPSRNSDSAGQSESPVSVFERIDGVIRRIKDHRTETLTLELKDRDNRLPDFGRTDAEILKVCIEAIAFSRQARSNLVKALIARGTLGAIFNDYENVSFIAALEPEQLLAEHWHKITPIRQKQKLTAMTNCAKAVARIGDKHGSLMLYLKSFSLPVPLRSEPDIATFWTGFGKIRADFKRFQMPYFDKLTSLCHLLQLLGFDCAKPDSAVMKAAVKLGIASHYEGITKDDFSEMEKYETVKLMQQYCISRTLRVPALDLYFLIYGEQTEARNCVNALFYST